MHTEWAKSVLFHFQTDVWPWGCAVQRSPSLFSISFYPPLFQLFASVHPVPSCVCLHYLFAYQLQYASCVSDRSPFCSAGVVQPTLYKQQDARSDAKQEVWSCVQHSVINTNQTATEGSFVLSDKLLRPETVQLKQRISWFTGYFCFNVSCTIRQTIVTDATSIRKSDIQSVNCTNQADTSVTCRVTLRLFF